MSKRNDDVNFITLLMNDSGLKEAIQNSASTQEILSAYNAGKNKQASETKHGCLTWIALIVAVIWLASKVSASEIPKEIISSESNKLFGEENNESSSYADRLIASGIPVTKEQLDVASMLDDMSKSSVGAGKTPVIINPIKNR